YLRSLAEQIVQATRNPSQPGSTQLRSIKKSDVDAVIPKLMKLQEGDTITLPDSREAKISGLQKHTSSSTLDVISWKLRTVDGQTLYVKRITRKKDQRKVNATNRARVANSSQRSSSQIVNSWVKLPVTNFAKSRAFYADVIGLKVQFD